MNYSNDPNREKIPLNEWLKIPRTEEEKQKDYQSLFYGLQHTSHVLANSYHAFIPYFDSYYASSLDKILHYVYVGVDPSSISFIGSQEIPSSKLEEAKQKNIAFMTTFMLGLYLGYEPQNGLLNETFIENNFEQCKQFLPSEDVPYFEQVLIHHQYTYYDDYANKASYNNEGGRGRSYTKKTNAQFLPDQDGVFSVNRLEGSDYAKAGFSKNIAFLLVLLGTVLIALGVALLFYG